MGSFRSIVAALLLATLSGCSPYGFSKQVSDINGSVQALNDSVTSGHKALVDDQTAHYRRALIANRSNVVMAHCEAVLRVARHVPTDADLAKKDDDPVAKPPPRQPCDVYLLADMNKSWLGPPPLPDKLTLSMKALTDYMGALAAVTNATDRDNYNAAVTKLGTAVSGIMTAAGGPAGAAVGAGINLFGWLLGNALDIQRFESLKAAVNKVGTPPKPGDGRPFDDVVQAIASSILALAEDRRSALTDDIGSLKLTLGHGVSEEVYRARLADIQSMAAVVESLNTADPQSAANALMLAHAKLVKAVNEYQPDLASLITTIGTLKDQVSALQTALAAASAPASSSKKGS